MSEFRAPPDEAAMRSTASYAHQRNLRFILGTSMETSGRCAYLDAKTAHV